MVSMSNSDEDAHERVLTLGFSPQRLRRIENVLGDHLRRGRMAGAAFGVTRAGAVVISKPLGVVAAKRPEELPEDAIFRVHSMTKPLVSVVALGLVEEGLLTLEDEVADHLPEFADPAVMADGVETAGLRHLAEADRPIMVLDLMRHTAGLAGGDFGPRALTELYQARGLLSRCEVPGRTTREFIEELASVPLAHQPGTQWHYGRAGDVLGHLMERVTGVDLAALVADRLTEPLGMKDTRFHVPVGELGRVARATEIAGAHVATLSVPDRTPPFVSGGSGAYSTVRDYLRFGEMLLGRGALGNTRVLGPKTADVMMSDHLGPLRGTGPDYIPGDACSFGLGLAVRVSARGTTFPGSRGECWWMGRAGTSFFVDPLEGLVGVLMLQRYAQPEERQARFYQRLFKTLVYQALVD